MRQLIKVPTHCETRVQLLNCFKYEYATEREAGSWMQVKALTLHLSFLLCFSALHCVAQL